MTTDSAPTGPVSPSVDEQQRLAALRSLAVLDTPPEPLFDDLARLAAAICGTPIALVSLIDQDRQWFKARVGLHVPELPRETSFCVHAIRMRAPLVIADATLDPRFADNPLVRSEPYARFYAGHPLVTPRGHALGTLCVIDCVPRALEPAQLEALALLARQVVGLLELRRPVPRPESARPTLTGVHAPPSPHPTGTFSAVSSQLIPAAPQVRPRAPWIALAVALVGLTLTAAGYAAARASAEAGQVARFDAAAATVRAAIEQRLAGHEEMLMGARAFAVARPELTREEWRAFAAQLALTARPGVIGLGLARWVAGHDRAAFEQRGRRELAGFAVHPPGPREVLLPVLFLEPRDAANASALGFDLLAEPRRREAIERALAIDRPVMTSRVALLEGGSGVVMLLPVRVAGVATAVVFASVRVAELVREQAPGERLKIELLDAADAARAAPIAERDSPGEPPVLRQTQLAFEHAGRSLLLRVTAGPDFDDPAARREPQIALLGGLLASGLAAAVAWSVASTWARARDLASRLSREASRSEARVRTLVDNVAEGILTFDENGVVRWCNAAAERIFGAGATTLLGCSIEELVPVARGDLRDGFRNEAQGRRRDGSLFPLELSVSEMRDEDRPLFIALVRDATERRRAQEELRTSEARTRSVVENLLGGLLTLDGSGRVESANAGAGALFEIAPDRLVGREVGALIADGAGRPAAFDRLVETCGRVSEWQGRRADDGRFPLELSLFEFEAGGTRRYGAHVRDVSERREVERLKDEFVSTVSHELRTPLTSIRGSLGLLQAGALGALPAEAAEAVEIAERNSTRLLELINDILDLERMRAGRLVMHMGPVSTTAAVAKALESVAAVATARAVRIDVHVAELVVRADPDRLVQVLVNLLSNAVKFSPEGNAVIVHVERIADEAELRVVDRGRGVPPQFQQAIFERFKQVESSDARDKGGSGLGLAICRAIVAEHGGRIGVDSQVGEGSVFWVRLPLSVEEAA